jgi:hypothetical protein
MLTLHRVPRIRKVYVYRATSNTKSKWTKVQAATLFKQIVTLVLIATGLLLATPKPTDEITKVASAASSQTAVEAVSNSPAKSPKPGTISASIVSSDVPIDTRADKLGAYLQSKGSPFADHAADFIAAADRFDLDWKLLPSISGVESGFGHALVPGSYNAWGWGGGYIRFASWTDAINTIAQSLREKYANHGLITPQEIGPVYAPPSYTWASNVQMYMNQIEKL